MIVLDMVSKAVNLLPKDANFDFFRFW